MSDSRDDATYFVTDIECSGFRLDRHSMISFATVAVTGTGEERGRFEAVLAELSGATWDPGTRAWFEDQEPAALAAATTDPRDPAEVMQAFVTFVGSVPGTRIFAAHPLGFDGSWVDHYLRRFTDHQLLDGLYDDDPLFHDTLCLRSYGAAVTARFVRDVSPATLPSEWFGDVPHSHRAIDDALGYANLLVELFRRAGTAAQKSRSVGSSSPRSAS
jgi:DNA polymerase III epsilon subunit-like protein